MSKTIQTLITCITLTLIATQSKGASLGGTVYVPNLHAKCLSLHQNCLLECATPPENKCYIDNINQPAKKCATNCVQDYINCEEILAKLRCLDNNVPIPQAPQNVKELLKVLNKEINNEK